MHLTHHVSDDLPVTATSATMAKWISGEIDAALSGTFEIQKHSHGVPCWTNGEQSFWHNAEQFKTFLSDHDLFTCDMQVSMLEQELVPLQATYLEHHQAPLQDIHYVHFDLEDLAFQDFKEELTP